MLTIFRAKILPAQLAITQCSKNDGYILRHFGVLGSFCLRRLLCSLLLICASITAHGDQANALTRHSELIDTDRGGTLYNQKCLSCHGAQGNAVMPQVPNLAGQGQRYLLKQLMDYQQNNRVDPIMVPIAKTLSADEINNILAYLAKFKPNKGGVDANLRARGQQLYRAGDAQAQTPACSACHGPAGLGNNQMMAPRLAGQNTIYLTDQLILFQQHKRTNDRMQMMQTISAHLSDNDKRSVASFSNGLRSRGE